MGDRRDCERIAALRPAPLQREVPSPGVAQEVWRLRGPLEALVAVEEGAPLSQGPERAPIEILACG